MKLHIDNFGMLWCDKKIVASFNPIIRYQQKAMQDAKTIAHRVNVHDELVAALAGMLAINDSVTQGQEREYREKFLPMARAALERAKQ